MTIANRAALTWENFDNRLWARFCATSAVQHTKREFLDLQKGNMSIRKFNSTCLEKFQFVWRLCPDETLLVAHYVEAIPTEYRATVWGKTALEAAIEEARFIEGDIVAKGRVIGVDDSKRKWDGPSDSSKKNVNYYENKKLSKLGESKWSVNCKASYNRQCSADTMRCRNCRKKGHTHHESKNVNLCYVCKETNHISRDCPKSKFKNDGGSRNWKCPRPTVVHLKWWMKRRKATTRWSLVLLSLTLFALVSYLIMVQVLVCVL